MDSLRDEASSDSLFCFFPRRLVKFVPDGKQIVSNGERVMYIYIYMIIYIYIYVYLTLKLSNYPKKKALWWSKALESYKISKSKVWCGYQLRAHHPKEIRTVYWVQPLSSQMFGHHQPVEHFENF